MCGIAGYIGCKKIKKKDIDLSLKSMIKRGPDNQKKIESIHQLKGSKKLHLELCKQPNTNYCFL